MNTVKLPEYYQSERYEQDSVLPQNYSRVLEIGCGTGGFISRLRKDCEKWGVEPEKTAAEKAGSNVDRMLCGTYESVEDELPDGYFDLVICNDVIEHMPDALAFFERIQRKMTANGVLTGSVPNVRAYQLLSEVVFKKDWKYTGKGILDSTHRYFFTIKSLRRILLDAGFEIELLKGINRKIRGKNLLITVLKIAVTSFWTVFALGTDVAFPQIAFRAGRK